MKKVIKKTTIKFTENQLFSERKYTSHYHPISVKISNIIIM